MPKRASVLTMSLTAAAIAAPTAGHGQINANAANVTTQSAAPEGQVVDQASAETAQREASANERRSEGGLEEIVVTAQRRAERQQDVPIAITSVSADLAERIGVASTESLSIAIPGLQFSRQTGNGGAPFLRGVGSSAAQQGASAPVAVYVDDVYIGVSSATTLSFNNIEQVDVLKGPQGTLFGRNATGGVVQIRTKRPSQEPSVKASIGYGNFNTFDGNLYVTGGLSDTVAVGFAAMSHNQGDGYGINVPSGEEVMKQSHWGVRGSAFWQPTDATSLLLIADYSKVSGDAGLAVTIAPGTKSNSGGTFLGRRRTGVPERNWSVNEQYGFSGRLDHDFGAIRVASITAYRENSLKFNIDNDAGIPSVVAVDAVAPSRTFSQELQLLSPTGGRLQWTTGLFYYFERAGYDPLITIGSSQAATGGSNALTSFQTLNSYSAFADASYDIFEGTKLTAGLRYTSDRFGLKVTRRNAAGAPISSTPFSVGSKFSKLTYRAVLDHHFTSDIMGYASYSRGFKSGGYNVSSPIVTISGVATPAPPVAPEVLDAFEVGLKTEWFDRRLRLNVAAFTYDYTDLQVPILGIGTTTTINAAAARIKGLDFDFEARPVRNLTISGGASILDAKYKSFPNGPLTIPNPSVCTPVPTTTGPLTGGNRTCPADLTGFRMSRAPKFTASLNATYTVPTNAGDFALTGSIYHNSGYVWDPDNRLRQPAHTLLSSTLSWTSRNGKYEVRVWGRNLTNKYYFDYVSASGSRDGFVPAAPRTYGASLGVNF